MSLSGHTKKLIVDVCMDFIFYCQVQQKEDFIKSILNKQAALTGNTKTIYSAFTYKGVVYQSFSKLTNTWEVLSAYTLHKELYPEIDEFIDQQNFLERDRAAINSYLRRVVNVSKSIGDIKALIIDSLYSNAIEPILTIEASLETKIPTLSLNEIAQFKEKNIEYEEKVKEMLVTQLLLR